VNDLLEYIEGVIWRCKGEERSWFQQASVLDILFTIWDSFNDTWIVELLQ
jgi:hypothetical protein